MTSPLADALQAAGPAAAGQKVRWSFREITPDAFRWLGEVSDDGGASFRLIVEFAARRAR